MLGVRVNIRVLGILRLNAVGNSVDLDFHVEPTIGEVILRLMDLSPGLRRLIWDDVVDSPSPNALILVNGVEVNNLEGLETRVGDGSEVVVLAVTHGG